MGVQVEARGRGRGRFKPTLRREAVRHSAQASWLYIYARHRKGPPGLAFELSISPGARRFAALEARNATR